jgi:hypothetical protein
MKIKLFEELTGKPSISFTEACEWIENNYPENKVEEMLDEEINGGNWIDTDQMEEEEYESEYDYYMDYGNGEAESAVRTEIINDLKSQFTLTFNPYDDSTDLSSFLCEKYYCINR